MMASGRSCELVILVLLILASYACIYLEFWKPRCMKPFVEIGDNCYFFSTNKAPTYEYYKVSYNGRIFSVPAILDWLHASFACETLDANARLLTVRTAEEMRYLSNYIGRYAHPGTHPFFWSGGHRGSLAQLEVDHSSLERFYWHHDPHPMNFSNFVEQQTNSTRFPSGFCVYLEYVGSELIMATASCKQKMAFACELQLLN
ncbi:uncharacterized protein LOC115763519 [Drosophila novamexicana]|uniref:C-type lectin domain-containing protein n=1 Tax=Drosophila virilis TaxID=7244 RepID=B4M954_DROVI|nr:uncharacterized protein LOC6633990 isoform X1 [Drosophila virilis]XP_030561981.1 uncharacterized protein LOC115763519 [Drosophila novamexicana]EDW57730.1 uncharacterized protein Dvir_GJ17983 [Drosophila virilis]